MKLAIATVIHGDCLEVMAGLPENSLDACVTDPPYGLSFMGKSWDHAVPGPDYWREVLRVLKPGAHLLAFGGTRTNHRMVCAIEDAGFEIRDSLQWIFGSGFPKSLDVSKAITAREKFGNSHSSSIRKARMGDEYKTTGQKDWRRGAHFQTPHDFVAQNSPTELTTAAREWSGFGTALKPAHEPIVLARKPLSEKTVAENVLRWGTGAINVDGCRVAAAAGDYDHPGNDLEHTRRARPDWRMPDQQAKPNKIGRWPANIIHDGSDEVVALFPETGKSTGGRCGDSNVFGNMKGQERGYTAGDPGFGDSGSAARFFYCAKAPRSERLDSKHPTVKPLKLMRYLTRLVTPPGGTVLDCFAGSGTTGEAALNEGFSALLIERDEQYVSDIRRRVERARGRSVVDKVLPASMSPSPASMPRQMELSI